MGGFFVRHESVNKSTDAGLCDRGCTNAGVGEG